MFMVKEEYLYIKKLTLTKIRSGKRGYFIYLAIMAFLMLSNLIPSIFLLYKDNNTTFFIKIQEFSLFLFFGLIIGYITINLLYRIQNDYYSIYPQTNSVRFLSSILVSFLTTVVVALTSLGIYIIDSIILRIISLFNKNIAFALNFDIGFVIVGFFTFTIYSLLLLSFFTLLGAIIRKFGIYAIIVLITLVATLIINIVWSLHIIQRLLGFIVYEQNIVLFFIKGIITIMLLLLLSFLFNHFTVYYKSTKITKNIVYIIILICLVFTVGFSILIGARSMVTTSYGHVTNNALIDSPFKTIEIDISHLEKNSTINVITNKNIRIPGEISYNQNDLYLDTPEPIKVTGNTLIVTYSFPKNIENNIDISKFTKPHISASMKGNTLYLDYEYIDHLKLIVQPIWGIANQFKIYRDKNVTTPFWSSSSSSGSGSLTIDIE